MMYPIPDPRHLANGREIPTETYSDQPYLVQTDDGAWLCVMTTGTGHEGDPGQHVVTMRSTDQGHTWTAPVDVEPGDGPEASYAVLFKAPSGRIYCFYNYNADNRRWVHADDPPFADGKCYRVDTQGAYVFKYSDDHGQHWSAQRYQVPIRNFAIDRSNPYGGTVQFFWSVGKPFLAHGAVYLSIHKVGGFGEGFMTSSQGALVRSADLLSVADPAQATWVTLPDGDVGLRTPPGGGPVADEQNYVVLSDGSFYGVYRSIDGHPVGTYSRDGGHTWSVPQYQRYADGRLMKHPRAANFIWKCHNGHYLYWFHNHGGRLLREHPQRRTVAYQDRNPVWLCGGREIDAPEGKIIQWSQPEILLYDDDPWIRMSYPDLIEEDGRYFVTETQKDVARLHAIDPTLVAALWQQFTRATVSEADLLLALPNAEGRMPLQVLMPLLPPFTQRSNRRADHGTEDLRQGITFDLWVRFASLDAGQILLDNRTATGQGFCLQTTARTTVELVLNDGRAESRWDCDPALLTTDEWHHLVVIVDGGPKVITFLVDGQLCDGGEFRQFGWGRFYPYLRQINGAATLRIGPALTGEIRQLRLYARALRTSEAIGNYRATLR
ncbi:MAG: exo-alpha-sialidase [Caldilineaceae bacterium]|nr:exo-alpha-sialidase [Caldilineaceae bacterium]